MFEREVRLSYVERNFVSETLRLDVRVHTLKSVFNNNNNNNNNTTTYHNMSVKSLQGRRAAYATRN